MKRLTAIITAFIMSASMCAVSHANEDISVYVNGTQIATDVAPVIINDRTMVPVRAIAEALNCDVAWDADTKGVAIYRKDHLYNMWIDHDTAFDIDTVTLNNSYKMDTAPMVINDRTMLPLRAVAELLGAEVSWDGESKTVTVNLELGEIEDNAGVAQECIAYSQSLFATYDIYEPYMNNTANTKKAKIELTDGGIIELELYPEIAPATCENFIALANEGFYDGLIFHRVIEDFMIQGGGFDENMEQKPSENIKGEFILNGFFNLIPHTRGTISMARAQTLDSASSQFFIMHQDGKYLDGQYAAFGKVTSGIEYVDKIAVTETDENDKPIENMVIKSIRVE